MRDTAIVSPAVATPEMTGVALLVMPSVLDVPVSEIGFKPPVAVWVPAITKQLPAVEALLPAASVSIMVGV